jgi:hypothetical protein
MYRTPARTVLVTRGAAHDVSELGEIARVSHIGRDGADWPDMLRGGRQ